MKRTFAAVGLSAHAVLLAGMVNGGCVAAPEETGAEEVSASDVSEDLGHAAEEIAAEHAGGVAQVAVRLYTDPELTRTGYATPSIGGCSGSMIGPNVLMTASHCGDADQTISFYTYRDDDPTKRVTENFSCRILVNTFHHSDLTLFFCDPNAAGENPGDKYGYLDFDHSAPAVGQKLYSYWYNPVVSLGLGWDEIYAQGQVTATNATIWGAAPGDSGPINQPIGIATDLWTQPGASGSSMLNPANYRIMAGPTSTGVNDAPGRWALSSKQYFELGSVDGWLEGGAVKTGIHNATLSSLGVTPGNYAGRLDKNNDYIFDVQQDIERVRGENKRDWIFLGFDSERRNALWDLPSGGLSFDTVNRNANINVVNPNASGWDLLVHRRLKLDANARYRVSFMIATNSASSDAALRVVLRNGGVEQSSRTITPAPGAGWQMVTFALSTLGTPPELAIKAFGTMNASITSLSLVRDGAVMDFDTADKRFSWRNDNNGQRGRILPEGTVAGAPNWAAVADPTPSQPVGADWPLRNRQLAIVPDTTYVVCFDAKQRGVQPAVNTDQRAMRVVSGGAEVVRALFIPGATWQRYCSAAFHAPSPDNNMQFGFAGPKAGSYLVDNVQILRQPISYFSFSASNTNTAQVNTKDTVLSLSEGQTISMGTCGVAGAVSSGDTYLRLYGPSGQVAFNDDGCGGLSSYLSYTVPAGGGGTYTIRAGCFSASTCSGTVGYTVP